MARRSAGRHVGAAAAVGAGVVNPGPDKPFRRQTKFAPPEVGAKTRNDAAGPDDLFVTVEGIPGQGRRGRYNAFA